MTELASTIVEKVFHWNMDFDDVTANLLLTLYGERKYKNIRSATLRLTKDHDLWGKTPEELESEGALVVGIEGRIDEHAHGDQPRKTLPDGRPTCAAMLVAEDLGIEKNPELKLLLDYALRNNSSACATEWDLSLLCKLAMRGLCNSGSDEEKTGRVSDILHASNLLLISIVRNEEMIVNSESRSHLRVIMSMDTLVANWLSKRFGDRQPVAPNPEEHMSLVVATRLGIETKPEFRRVINYAGENFKVPEGAIKSKFGLHTLFYLAQEHLCGGEDNREVLAEVVEAVEIFLDGIYMKEHNFHVVARRDWYTSTTSHLLIETPEKDLGMTIAESSCAEFQKFCRSEYGGYADIIVKFDKGYCQIFPNKKSYEFDVSEIVAGLRIATLMEKKLPIPSEEVLRSEGAIAGADEFYFDGYQVLNGSLAYDRPKHILTEGIIVRIAYGCIVRRARKGERLTMSEVSAIVGMARNNIPTGAMPWKPRNKQI